MNGNDDIQKTLLDHEIRVIKVEEAIKHVIQLLGRIENEIAALGTEQKASRESFVRSMDTMRLEFHRDRRFSAFIFLTTQLAVIGALLRLAGIL